VIFAVEKAVLCSFFGLYFDLDFKIFKTFWTTVGLGLSDKNSGLDLDRKIRRSSLLLNEHRGGEKSSMQ